MTMAYQEFRERYDGQFEVPRAVRIARVVAEQSISRDDRCRARQVINHSQGERVPVLESDEQLFTDAEIETLVGQTDQSDSLASILRNSDNLTFAIAVQKLVDQILNKWKSKHADSPAVLQTARARFDDHDSRPLQTSEYAMYANEYYTSLHDIEIEVCSGGMKRIILLIEVMEDQPCFEDANSAEEDVTTGWTYRLLDFVYECMTYSMLSQRAILRNADGQFVVVSLLLFKDAAFVVKLTSNDWWSYLYKLDVYKYTFGNTEDVNKQARDLVNLLQLYVSRVLTANADTNDFLNNTLQQDLSQLELANYMVEYPSYPADAHVETLPHVCLNHIRKCKLKDCVQSLIRQSSVIWPSLGDAEEISEWLKKLEEDDGNTQVVVKVITALNYSRSKDYARKLCNFLVRLKSVVTDCAKASNDERKAKYKKVLDLYVGIVCPKDNPHLTVVVTKYKGVDRCASGAFLSDWKNASGVARESFHDEVIDLCIGMIEDDVGFRHCSIRPANIAVASDAGNNHEVTVIDWDNVKDSSYYRIGDGYDNCYPYGAISGNDESNEKLAYAAYSACQLLVCIYILHRASKYSSTEDCYNSSKKVEYSVRFDKPLFTETRDSYVLKQMSRDASSGNVGEAKKSRLDDLPSVSESDSVAVVDEAKGNFVTAELNEEELAKRIEYDCFHKWVKKMGGNVFSDLNRFLTNQRGCTFELLRSHLKVALHTDVDN